MSSRLVCCLAVWTLFLVGSPIARAEDDETEVRNPSTSEKSCAELGSFVAAVEDVYGTTLVCAASEVTTNSWNPSGSQCSTKVSFEAAVEMCTLIGARLCTSEELANDEARNSGCSADLARVWTGTDWDCPVNYSTTQAGSSEYLGLHPAECTAKSDTAYVRCCADACPDICALDPCGDAANTCTAIITPGSGDLRRQSYPDSFSPAYSPSYSSSASYVPASSTSSYFSAYSSIPSSAYSTYSPYSSYSSYTPYTSTGYYPSSSYSSYNPYYSTFPSWADYLAMLVEEETNEILPQCTETYTCQCGEDYELFEDDETNTCELIVVPTSSPTMAPTMAPTIAPPTEFVAPTAPPIEFYPIYTPSYPVTYNPYPSTYNPYYPSTTPSYPVTYNPYPSTYNPYYPSTTSSSSYNPYYPSTSSSYSYNPYYPSTSYSYPSTSYDPFSRIYDGSGL